MGMIRRGNAGSNNSNPTNTTSCSDRPPYSTKNDYFVEDYGDFDYTDATARGLWKKHGYDGNTIILPPSGNLMICLWSCRRAFFNTVTFSVASMISSFVAMQIVDSVLVMVSSTITIGISLLVLFQRRKIKQLGSLRRQHNNLRRQVNYFVQERERLNRTLSRLDDKMAALSNVPAELKKRLVQNGNTNCDRLVTIVEEQESIQEEIRKKIRQRVLQSIMNICVQADRDDNFCLTQSEIDVLISRLKLVEHIAFHEERLRSILSDDPTIKSILKVVRSLIDEDDKYKHGDPIFCLTLDNHTEKQRNDRPNESNRF